MQDMHDEESFLIVYRTAGNHSTFPDHESGQNVPVITRKKNTSGDENASSKKRKKLLLPDGAGVDVSESHQSTQISSSRWGAITSSRRTEREPLLLLLPNAHADVNRDAPIAIRGIVE